MHKYLISADIEGITGVASREFSSSRGRYYALGCRYMTSDVNAVIGGILAADPEAEIIVRDAHGSAAANLSLETLHQRAHLIQGWDAVQNMLTGLDEDFTAVLLVGYHVGGDNLTAGLGHTMHPIIRELKINGQKVNETGLFAFYAGYFKVPVIFVSGDEAAVSEAKLQLGDDLTGISVKKSFGRSCAESYSLNQSAELLKTGAERAIMQQLSNPRPAFTVKAPYTFTMGFYDTGIRTSVFQNLVEILSYDSSYHFDVAAHEISFTQGELPVVMHQLSAILYMIYGMYGG